MSQTYHLYMPWRKYNGFFFIFLSLSHFVVRLWLNPSLFHIVVFFMSYGGWFVLNIAVGMLQFYSGRSILLITRQNNSLGLFTICDKRQLERKATCSLVTLKPIYHNNPAKGWLKRCVLGKIQILNLIKKILSWI